MSAIIFLLWDLVLPPSTVIAWPILEFPFRYNGPKRFFPTAAVNPLQENLKDLFMK